MVSHAQSTRSPQSSVLAALCSVGLLDVDTNTTAEDLDHKPCQAGACDVSLRQDMRIQR